MSEVLSMGRPWDLARACGTSAVRLDPNFGALVAEIDLRLFFRRWRYGFAVTGADVASNSSTPTAPRSIRSISRTRAMSRPTSGSSQHTAQCRPARPTTQDLLRKGVEVPILAGMVQSPEQYRSPSYRWHVWGEPNPLLSDHDLYVRLGGERARAAMRLSGNHSISDRGDRHS